MGTDLSQGSVHARFSDFIHSPTAVLYYLKTIAAGHPRRFLGHNPAGGLMVAALLAVLFFISLTTSNRHMNKYLRMIGALFLMLPVLSLAGIDQTIAHYTPQNGLGFSAQRGDTLWHRKNTAKDGKERDCTVCHGDDLKKPGKHIKTGKVIDPMAPSVNHKRFTDIDKVEKWFLRNCKWTFGRECTDQEKGDILKYLSQF